MLMPTEIAIQISKDKTTIFINVFGFESVDIPINIISKICIGLCNLSFLFQHLYFNVSANELKTGGNNAKQARRKRRFVEGRRGR